MKTIKAIGATLSMTASIALAALFFGPSESRGRNLDQAAQAKPAPSWELKNIDGKAVHSADFKGKVVILDFWATWCPPCRAEISGFIALQKKYEAQGLMVVGVSVDQDGTDSVKAFVQKQGVNYPVVLADSKIVTAFGGIESIPTTFIIDRTGRIVRQHLGFSSKDEFEGEVKPLLKD
jgi:peroxiredoxin